MNLTPEQLEKLDLALLQLLDRNGLGTVIGLGARTLVNLVLEFGFNVKPEMVTERLHYLAGNGFAATLQKGQFHPAAVTWKITVPGVNHLRTQGL